MSSSDIEPFTLGPNVVHLAASGAFEAVPADRSFWTGETSSKYHRVLGVVDFASADDLYESHDEIHPDTDELIHVISGAVELWVDHPDGEQTATVSAGEAVIVPRGLWHHLRMCQPGRLVFVNNRIDMADRPHRGSAEEDDG